MAIRFEDKGSGDAKSDKGTTAPRSAEPARVPPPAAPADEPPSDDLPAKLPFAKSIRLDKKRKGR